MKKLISAAASLAMAASMVSSAVPFVTGAADSSKSFELRTFLDVNGKEVSSTVSKDAITAGDVVVPVGVFLKEDTADCDSLTAQFTVNSKDGDASNTYVSFKKHEAGSDYFKTEQEFKLASSSGKTKSLVGFAGVIENDEEDGDYFTASVKGQCFAEASSKSAGTNNAYGSFAMTAPSNGKGYKWSGSKSDDYPVFVVDVVFAKGTPAGTYTIDFCDYVPEPDYPDNYSCMVESPAGKMTTKNGKLSLKNLEIKIEGESSGTTASTTAAASTTTTQPTTTATSGSTTPSDSEVDEKFVVTPEDVTVAAGETVNVKVYATNGNNRKAGQFVAEVKNENLPIKGATATMKSTKCNAVATKPSYEEINGTWYCNTLDSGEPQEINTDEPVCRYSITIPADAKAGDYEWKLDRFHVVESGVDAIEFDAVLKTGKITVTTGGGSTTVPETETTTTAQDTTTASDTTTTVADTTTTAADSSTTAQTGDTLYGDTNCDGKVNIADVVVLNKYLNDAKSYDMKAQGKINADCCDAKGGEGLDKNDSEAIIKSIVHLVDISKGCTAADLK